MAHHPTVPRFQKLWTPISCSTSIRISPMEKESRNSKIIIIKHKYCSPLHWLHLPPSGCKSLSKDKGPSPGQHSASLIKLSFFMTLRIFTKAQMWSTGETEKHIVFQKYREFFKDSTIPFRHLKRTVCSPCQKILLILAHSVQTLKWWWSIDTIFPIITTNRKCTTFLFKK